MSKVANYGLIILTFQIANLSIESVKNILSKVKGHVLKVTVSDQKSAKTSLKSSNIKGKSTLLEPEIGTFETRFYTLETWILGFRKVLFELSLKGLGLE